MEGALRGHDFLDVSSPCTRDTYKTTTTNYSYLGSRGVMLETYLRRSIYRLMGPYVDRVRSPFLEIDNRARKISSHWLRYLRGLLYGNSWQQVRFRVLILFSATFGHDPFIMYQTLFSKDPKLIALIGLTRLTMVFI